MTRGAALSHPLEAVLLAQRAVTVALSGYNALYFASYRSPRGGRRFGAAVLALINVAIGAESLAFGLSSIAWGLGAAASAGIQAVAASLSLAAALVMTALIVLRHIRKR